jgi:hypothetical protein
MKGNAKMFCIGGFYGIITALILDAVFYSCVAVTDYKPEYEFKKVRLERVDTLHRATDTGWKDLYQFVWRINDKEQVATYSYDSRFQIGQTMQVMMKK